MASNVERYIEALLNMPEVKAVSRRAMRDILIYGQVMPNTLLAREKLVLEMRAKACADRDTPEEI